MKAPHPLLGLEKRRKTAVKSLTVATEVFLETPSFPLQSHGGTSYTLAGFPRGTIWLKLKVA